MKGLDVGFKALSAGAQCVTLGALDLSVALSKMEPSIGIRGETLPAGRARERGIFGGMSIFDMLQESFFPFANQTTLTTLFSARVNGIGMIDQMVPALECLVTIFALECLSTMHCFNVGVQAPRIGQRVAALPANVPSIRGDSGIGDGSFLDFIVIITLGESPSSLGTGPTTVLPIGRTRLHEGGVVLEFAFLRAEGGQDGSDGRGGRR